MKKRALSIVLALALCFTMFAGSGFAAGRVENGIQKVQNVLDNATPAQKDVINSVVKVDADVANEPWATLIAAAVADGGLLDGIFSAEDAMAEEDRQVLPYFLLRLVEDLQPDLSDKPIMAGIMNDFYALNDDINTAPGGVSLGFRESVNMFGDYGNRLTDICRAIVTDEAKAELVVILGLESEADIWPAAKEQAQSEAAVAFGYIQELIFSRPSEEGEETTFLENYKKIMANDRTKKNAAVFVGQDILNQINASLLGKLKKIVSFNSAIGYVNDHKANLFAADKNVAVPELLAVVKDFVSDVEGSTDSDIRNLIGLLEARGLTPLGVVNSLEIAANGLDPENGFQAVWYDLALGRLLKINDFSGDGVVDPEESIDLVLYNFRMDRYVPGYKGYSVDDQMNISFESDVEGFEVEDWGAAGHAASDYDRTLVNEDNKYVEVTVYRGKDDVDPADDVYRYIGKTSFSLSPATIDIALDATEYGRGDTVKITADVDGYETVTVTIYDKTGRKVAEYEDLDPDELGDEGIEYVIPENATAGKYTVVIGNENKTFEKEFKVVIPATPKVIVLDDSIANDETTPYVKPVELTVKGTQIEGFEAVTISIVDPEGRVFAYETLTPAQFLSGVKYNVSEDKADGWYTVVAGDADVTSDVVRFYVGTPAAEREITIDPIEDKSVGDELVVSGTSKGFAAINITIVDESGKVVVNESVLPDEDGKYSAVYTVAADWAGKYTVSAGDAADIAEKVEFNVVAESARMITIDPIEDKSVGDELVVSGTSKGFEAINITIVDESGKVVVNESVLPDEDGKYSATYTVAADWAGKYTVSAGDAADIAEKVEFNVVTEPARMITLDPITDKRAGEDFVVSGTSKGFEAINVTIVSAAGKVVVNETILPDADGKFSATYTVAADWTGAYTVSVGDAADVAEPVTFNVITESETKVLADETYDPKEIAAYVGTELDKLGLPTTVTLTNSDGDSVVVDIDWSGVEYDKNSTAVQTLVGTYTAPEGYELGGNADGKVEVKVQLEVMPVEKKITLATEDINGVIYRQGDTINIKGTSLNMEAIIISIVNVDTGDVVVYETVTPEEYAEGVAYIIPEDAPIGMYKVVVGDGDVTTEEEYPAVFEVKDKNVVGIVAKDYAPTTITDKKTSTSFGKLGVPTTVTLTLSDGTTVEAEIDWTDAKAAYKPASTAKQTLVGKIVLPDECSDYVFIGINDEVKVDVTLKSAGPSHGSTGGEVVAEPTKLIDAETAFSGDHVDIKGETSRNTLFISIVGPDGEVLKSETITGEQFKNGYKLDLSDLGTLDYGKYTVVVRDTANGAPADNYTFEIKRPMDSNIFNKADHTNYIVGYADGTVRPNDNIKREEVTTVLFRLLTEEARKDWLTETTAKFSDVEADRWSMTSIATLDKAGLLNGYEDGTFRPGNDITRAEFAALTARFALKDTETAANAYSDVAGHWAEADINAVSNAGWFQGADGKFRPDDKITRAEAVTVINRILERDKVDKSSFSANIVKFSDLSEDAWYYTAMVEATNSHTYDKTNTTETWKRVEEVTDWTSYEK